MTEIKKSRPAPVLWLSDSRGSYIPRDFATSFIDRTKSVSGVSDEDWATLEIGPCIENELYLDTWESVLDDTVVTDDKDGTKYFLSQDGDLWLIPVGMDWDDDENTWVWPEDEKED